MNLVYNIWDGLILKLLNIQQLETIWESSFLGRKSDIIYWSAVIASLYFQSAENNTIIIAFKIWQTYFSFSAIIV